MLAGGVARFVNQSPQQTQWSQSRIRSLCSRDELSLKNRFRDDAADTLASRIVRSLPVLQGLSQDYPDSGRGRLRLKCQPLKTESRHTGGRE